MPDCAVAGCLRGTVPNKPVCWVHGGNDQRGRVFIAVAVLAVGACVLAGAVVGAIAGFILDLRTTKAAA